MVRLRRETFSPYLVERIAISAAILWQDLVLTEDRETRESKMGVTKVGETGRENFERETFSQARINSTHTFLSPLADLPSLSFVWARAQARIQPSYALSCLVNLPSLHVGLRGKREKKRGREGWRTPGDPGSSRNDTKKWNEIEGEVRGTPVAKYRTSRRGSKRGRRKKRADDGSIEGGARKRVLYPRTRVFFDSKRGTGFNPGNYFNASESK